MNSLTLTDMAQAPTSTPRHRRLTRLAGFASWTSFASAALIVLATSYLWLVEGALTDWLVKSADGVMVTPTPLMIGAAGVVAMAPIALLVVMLVELGRLFRLFADGSVFDPAVPRRLGRVGWLAFSSCAATVVCKTLVTLLMTSANPPGHHMLTIGIDSQALAGLMLGFLFLVFSLVMQEALGIAEENRSFI
ncbi:hypothetical protein CXZ10_15465 [Pleomorphomonas diazotrophica]|uniref:DUF2975 domain-containing protein n=1 Tax=Pleomorphomonas diazotrophica TaxID=1166257 RepID=A0A1I4W2D0_9HYPH|nr:DUF2975 domain-containing protein [Pleomorphomonas diazotrophica]PKR88196.1 hypothetical protein CXZ10_15465 [Pleomorphomonas diazotrophica]SFN07517.1 Protein of unknown function [Pleomorphomonas diazotrophica]